MIMMNDISESVYVLEGRLSQFNGEAVFELIITFEAVVCPVFTRTKNFNVINSLWHQINLCKKNTYQVCQEN